MSEHTTGNEIADTEGHGGRRPGVGAEEPADTEGHGGRRFTGIVGDEIDAAVATVGH